MPPISRLHPHVHPPTVRFRVDIIRLSWVFQFLDNVPRACKPAFGAEMDVRGGGVVGL